MLRALLVLLRSIGLICCGHRAIALENLALRQQLAVLRRTVTRPHLRSRDRLFWILLAKGWRDWRSALIVVQPDTVVRWHRQWLRRRWTRLSQPFTICVDCLAKLEAPPGFEPGWRFCRFGRGVYFVDSPCFLAGPTPPSCLVFGCNRSQVVPKFARRSCETLCNVGGQSVQTVNDAVIQDSIPCAGEVPRAGRRESGGRWSSPCGLCRPVEDERDRLLGAAILVRNGEKPPAAMFRVVHRSSNVRQSMTTTNCGSGPIFRRKRPFLSTAYGRLSPTLICVGNSG
jgi:hypothetical protein